MKSDKVVYDRPVMLICPSCGSRRGYNFGTGDCGCDSEYTYMDQEAYEHLFPDAVNTWTWKDEPDAFAT